MTTDVRDLGLLCCVCGQEAHWALARLSDRYVTGYCSPNCALEDLSAALAPQVVVEGEAVDATVSPQEPSSDDLSPEDASILNPGTVCPPGAPETEVGGGVCPSPLDPYPHRARGSLPGPGLARVARDPRDCL